MKKIISILFAASFVLTAILFFPSCDPSDPIDPNDLEQALGWFGVGGENGDDLSNIEDDINFGSGSLPSSVDLSENFPPIGDQGSYGTCVAWAVGYNHKSYMEAMDHDHRTTFTSSQKFSPKYLFWKIPSASKGSDCNGTGFEPAYDVLLESGITSLATSPYTGLGDCSSSPSSSENTSAATYKIQSYREVDVDKDKLKQYLAQGRALSFGAKLGDNFMSANSDAVHSSDTYGYSGQHAYHAMTLCGYDDSKSAFRIVNTWGTSWGDHGYLWVDYNFFTGGDFAFCAFAATNVKSNPDEDGDNEVDDPSSGIDLMAWELYDVDDENSTAPLDRVAKYNAFNSGDEQILASQDWNMLYIYYDANDANNYGIMLYDYYSDDYGSLGDDGNLDNEAGFVAQGDQNWYNYINIPAGQSVAQALYGGNDARFSWPYTMPSISGEYYLVIIVDGYDVINEYDESNNYFYLTDSNGGPITFSNGIMQEATAKSFTKNMNPQKGDNSPMQTVRTKQNLNTYSTKEIQTMLKHRLATGDIQRKAAEFVRTSKNQNRKSNN